jgi:HlyD family secretion protein
VKEAEAADFERHAAEHQRSLARAALARARGGRAAAGERWEIASPVDGRVLRVAQESEAVVAVGAAILELGDPRNLEIVVDALTADATLIKPGAAAHIDVGSGHPSFEGRVRLVEPSAFTKVSALGIEEQRVNVVIDPVAANEQWSRIGDGYRVDARIVAEQRSDAVLVPLGAVFRERDAWAAYALEGGRARLKAVQLGPRSATHAVVQAGLDPGEVVIVYPGDAVADGVRVAPRAR